VVFRFDKINWDFILQGLMVLFFYFQFTGSLPAQEKHIPTDYSARLYDSLGLQYSKSYDNEKALMFFEKALKSLKEQPDTSLLIKVNENISHSLQQLKRYRDAVPYQLEACRLWYLKNHRNPDVYYRKVEKLLSAGDDSLNTTRLYYRFGLLLDKFEKKKESAGYFLQALKLARQLNYDKAVSTIANDLAGEYWDLGEKDLSTLTYQKALEAAVRLNDSNRMASAYLNIGDNYKDMGELEKGMDYLLKALRIKESISDSSRLCFYYIKAGELAKMSLNHKKWKEYIFKAYQLKDKPGLASELDKALIYQNLGEIAVEEGQNDKAFLYFDTLEMVSREANYQNGLRVSLTSRADLYEKMGEPEKALELLNEASEYVSENPFFEISSNNNRAQLYMDLNRDKEALPLLMKNIHNPSIENYADLKLITLKLLYKVNTRLANYQKAFVWNDSLREFENRLRDKEVRTTIAELETKYETEKNKHTISSLRAKNEYYNQQIRLFILLIVILIVVIILIIYILRMNRLKSQMREDQLRQSLLRSQMNPHFIFNALNSIRQLISKNKNKEASHYLSKFSSLSRIILEYSAQESIPLEKEIELLSGYIEIEKLRSGNVFDYEIITGEDMEVEFIEIPPMAIQPFVENAIKHGLKQMEKGGFLRLIFEEHGDILKVTIEDNGVGINNSKEREASDHRSMAMNIFETRRKLFQKQYKKKLEVSIVDLSSEGKSGTRVTIELPIL
jgi:tetratricopeptide (TPR) repeat protein